MLRRGLHSRHALQAYFVPDFPYAVMRPVDASRVRGLSPAAFRAGFDAVVQSKRLALPLSFPRNGVQDLRSHTRAF